MIRRLKSYLQSCQQVEPIELNLLVPSRNQVRSSLGDLNELCASIKELGLLQPILVRPSGSRFEVMCGHRRLEACRRLMKRYVDCIIKDLTDQEAFEISLVENIQRKTLSSIEEAKAFHRYVTEFGWGGISDLARRIGKSEEYVSHRILLLSLPEKILAMVANNDISTSQAQELVWIKENSVRDLVFNRLGEEHLSVGEIRQIRKELESSVQSLSVVRNKVDQRSFYSCSSQDSPLSSPDSRTDFELCQVSKKGDNETFKDHKIIEEAILALRVALIRLDFVISKCKSKTMKDLLMSERLSLHGQIDRLVRAKARI